MAYQGIENFRPFSDKILSSSYEDGRLLSRFLNQERITREIYRNYEILDFQRYRVIKRPGKIASYWQMSKDERVFLFLINKN